MSSFAEMEFKAFKSTFETKVQMLWKIFEKELQCVRSEVREARTLLDTTIKEKTSMEEDVDQLKVDVGELKDLLTNSKGEVNHIRSGLGDVQEALKNHDSWMEDVSNTLRQMQEKDAQSELNSLQKLIDQHDEQLSTFREESAQRQEAAQKELNSLQMLVGQHDERLRALPEDVDQLKVDVCEFKELRTNSKGWMEDVSNTLRQMQEKDTQSELNNLQKLIHQHDEQLSTFREESARLQEKELNSLQMLVGQHDERLRTLPEDLDRRFADLKDFVEGRVAWLQEGVQVMLEDMDQARCCEDFRQQCGGLEVGSAPVEEAIHWQDSPRRYCFDSASTGQSDLLGQTHSPWSEDRGTPASS